MLKDEQPKDPRKVVKKMLDEATGTPVSVRDGFGYHGQKPQHSCGSCAYIFQKGTNSFVCKLMYQGHKKLNPEADVYDSSIYVIPSGICNLWTAKTYSNRPPPTEPKEFRNIIQNLQNKNAQQNLEFPV